MSIESQKGLLTAALAGALIVGIGAADARAQNRNELPPGSRADRREDRREIKQLRLQVNEDQRGLEADVRQFGRLSPQARVDREHLRQDRGRLRQLQRDLRRDERIKARPVN